jgi:hypothetical protein
MHTRPYPNQSGIRTHRYVKRYVELEGSLRQPERSSAQQESLELTNVEGWAQLQAYLMVVATR